MKSVLRLLLLFLPILALAACGTKNPHKVIEKSAGEETIPLKAVVTDFEDARPHEAHYNQSFTMIPLMPYGGYSLDRHDSVYSSQTEPFPTMAAKALTDRLREAHVFEEVKYVPSGELPAAGEQDVIVRGRLLKMQSKGGITRYGLSVLGDLFWEIGMPNRSRRWAVEAEYWLEDAYTGEQITELVKAELETSRSIYTKYFNVGKVDDLKKKSTAVYDSFIAQLWEKAPAGSDPSWAQVREQGQKLIAQQEREQDRIRKGSPPTFSFLSPADGSTVRAAQIPVRWSIAAPMRLKTVVLGVNGEPVRLPVDKLAMENEETAPLSIPAQDVQVPLQLGQNTLEARLSDHRGNETRATFTLTRMPRPLSPERRYALLVGTGGSDAQQSVEALKRVLTDPILGQFAPADVTTIAGNQLSGSEFKSAINSFGRKPLAGDLVVVYFAADGEAASLKVGDGAMTLDDAVGEIVRSLATENVVFLEDVNWSGSGSEPVDERLSNLPRQWAYVTPNSEGGARAAQGGTSLLAGIVADVFRGEPGDKQQLTLERFVDLVLVRLERSGKGSPDKYGYYSPNITMAERE